MEWQKFLTEWKKKHPKVSHKEAQKRASKEYQKHKKQMNMHSLRPYTSKRFRDYLGEPPEVTKRKELERIFYGEPGIGEFSNPGGGEVEPVSREESDSIVFGEIPVMGALVQGDIPGEVNLASTEIIDLINKRHDRFTITSEKSIQGEIYLEFKKAGVTLKLYENSRGDLLLDTGDGKLRELVVMYYHGGLREMPKLDR